MLRSMYSGITGMKVNQTKLDVIGNNISNVGTTSFKGSRVTFSDMLSQSKATAMSPSTNQGGVNGKQIGLGVQLSSIDRVMTQGMMQPTGRALDVAIDGDGFFMVSKGPTISEDGVIEVDHRAGTHGMTSQSLATAGSEVMYSRDGAFVLDADGNLLTKDGFRIMGYSVTNDDSSQSATGLSSSNVNTSGLDFTFGPGSQLNGYKVVLGAVGPGTVTSATLNKDVKTIVLNGDFSTPGALTAAQVESAINKGLSAAGVSQAVFVKGTPATFEDLGSDSILNGTDAKAPSAVAIAGVTLQFTEGSELNGYTFEVRNVSSGTALNATVDTSAQKIIIDGDFVNGTVTSLSLKDAINSALSAKNFTMQIMGTPSGSITRFPKISATTDALGTIAAAPTGNTVTGFPITGSAITSASITAGSSLNGYTINFVSTTGSSSVEVSGKTITVNAGATDTIANLQTTIDNSLLKAGITNKVTLGGTTTATVGTFTSTPSITVGTNGTDNVSPTAISLGGFNVAFPTGTEFNNAKFQLGNINTSTAVTISPTPIKQFATTINGVTVQAIQRTAGANVEFIVSGEFSTPGKVKAADLQSAIDASFYKYTSNTNTLPATVPSKVKITGNSTGLSGSYSNEIDGGEELGAPSPSQIDIAGVNIVLGEGAGLNGYTFRVGKISAGTDKSVDIDEKAKTITINADFVTPGAINITKLESMINTALVGKSLPLIDSITGGPLMLISGSESDATLGGTPVQSLDTDGAINFVDGTKELKSYDGSLKTLKIPEKVRIPGTDTELRVKSYNIDKTGVINGILEDGRVAALGQIAMASFKNPEGLTSLGGNLYGGSANSGDPVLKSGIGTLQDDNSKGYGDNLQGMLEMSNVDLAEQFTDMIVTTKAFQAAGKMITTGDEILQDIINLKR